MEETLAGIRVDGLEHLRSAMEQHGRALLLTAHLGNWELSRRRRLTGYPLSVVLRPLDAPWLDRLIARSRAPQGGVELIDKRAALRPVLRALRRGPWWGSSWIRTPPDAKGSSCRSSGVRPAPRGAWPCWRSARTPIVPAFIRREADGTHRVVLEPALTAPPPGDLEMAIVALTARCTEAIERAVRETPDQWLWMHDRWRTRPPAPAPA